MAGYIRIGDEIVGELPGEPLLDRTDWQELVMKIESRRGRPPSSAYQCSGIVRCGQCDGRITGRTNAHAATYADGTVRHEYCCRMDAGSCGRTVADVRELDEAVRLITVDRMSDPATVEGLRRQAEAAQAAKLPHIRELERLHKVREHWDARLLSNAISVARHEKLMAETDQRLAEVQAAIKAVGEVRIPAHRALPDVQAEWERSTVERRRAMIREAFTGVTITCLPGSAVPGARQLFDEVDVK